MTPLEWCHQWFDPDAALLWNPEGSYGELAAPRSLHLVPQSGWYAAGLLAAAGAAAGAPAGAGGERQGDAGGAAPPARPPAEPAEPAVARATAVFERLCDLQYRSAPAGATWRGTFARFAESPVPPATGAVEWVDYDPNWRQFLGTCFSLVLRRFPGALPPSTEDRMREAVALAVSSEPPDRVPPTYSNIALMRAWLEVEAGVPGAASYADDVVRAFDRFGAFEEYNSPTYYGIDLFALGLWARWSTSDTLRRAGARVEAALWRDVARWWHAGLGNLCGPWSRAYGMDMQRYAALLGLFVGPSAFPALAAPFDHSHDTTFAPMVALVGGDTAGVPADVRGALAAISGERVVTQQVTAERVATGWLAPTVMIGAEAGGAFPARGQYHPATVHWRLPPVAPSAGADGGDGPLDGGAGGHGGGDRSLVGWLRVRHTAPVDATAAPGRLVVEARGAAGGGPGDATILVEPAALERGHVPVRVEADGRAVDVTAAKTRLPGASRVVVHVVG